MFEVLLNDDHYDKDKFKKIIKKHIHDIKLANPEIWD